ncbi:MAG: T9SS C-terminal target domain-containing protein [Bacteroidetes bacterium]|nr:MAG: T9SS C-terminal target domain-containing protein [Bacteroidota bacterium]REK08063.1 MAG: T9SS C-terminal target domain-containing protein [Bacteroidota bacterium]REK32268.1 MAG: T9SS C-terminal target domain-containing protein [Bacteroidota bacterium]REK47420.1 MAG: T9SS C-terminal target domain-containing protein [Bacteroidota bacterium]
MKKILLICAAVSLVSMGNAQQIEKRLPEGFRSAQLPERLKNQTMVTSKHDLSTDNGIPFANPQTRQWVAPTRARFAAPTINEEIVGFTYYDLQTNNSISNRLVRSADGSFSAVWTFSPDAQTNFPNRGTGYNYYDPNPTPGFNNWYFTPLTPSNPAGAGGDYPSMRTEGTYRTGFTNIAVTSSGKEMSIAHSSSLNRMLLNWRQNKGTGVWNQLVNALGTGTNNDTWSKATASGETVHAIWQGAGVVDPPVRVEGQLGPIYYSRSNDGGVTWPVLRTVIPLIDSTQFDGFGGDNYGIDSRGNTVAIVFSDITTGVGILKSTDGGVTWNRTMVQTFPIPLFDPYTMITDIDMDGVVDTIDTNSGDGHVLIDRNGMCHVWFSKYRMYRDSSATAGSFTYFPGQDGLYYWNETMATDAFVIIAEAQDFNGNGFLDVPATTSDGGLCSMAWGNYRGTITGMPSAGVDANNVIYVSYQTIDERADTTLFHQAHRHVFVIASYDNGQTWSYPTDIVLSQAQGGDGEFQECAFASMAKDVDNNVYILYQRDGAPGHGLNTTGCDPSNNLGNPSDIVFTKLEAAPLRANNKVDNNGVAVSQNYPNPSNGYTTFNVNLRNSGSIDVKVTDVLGKTVYSEMRNNALIGMNTFNLNTTEWNAGVYFYTVEANGAKYTKQLIVR